MEMIEKMVDGVDLNGVAGKFLVRVESEVQAIAAEVVQPVEQVVAEVVAEPAHVGAEAEHV